MDSGRQETSLGRRAGSWPPAPLSAPQDQAFLRPALGRARRSRGRKRKEVLCISFFQPCQPKQKKSHLKRPRDPLRSQLPTSGLSRAAAAAFTHARSSQHPAPHFRVPAAAAAAASLPGKPPSFLRVAGEGAAPRACSEHVPAAVPARPRCRWPARKQAVLASRGKQAARPGNPREGVLLLRPPVPDVVRLGLRASLTRGVRFLRDLSPTRLLIAGLGLPTGWGAEVTWCQM